MMTLGNMRENGVRSLAITCGALWCHHHCRADGHGLHTLQKTEQSLKKRDRALIFSEQAIRHC
jgi:hypothetical protein